MGRLISHTAIMCAAQSGHQELLDLSWEHLIKTPNSAHQLVCLQEFLEKYFPTREVFAALAPFVLRVAPRWEREVQAFKARHFQLYTIGIQIRRRKCNGDRGDLLCELRPTVESYCQVCFH